MVTFTALEKGDVPSFFSLDWPPPNAPFILPINPPPELPVLPVLPVSVIGWVWPECSWFPDTAFLMKSMVNDNEVAV